MSVVLLVRHGQASWGAADYDRLSSLGEQQSRVLGAALASRGVRPDLVVRGAMRRHRQTAEATAAGAGWSTDVGITRCVQVWPPLVVIHSGMLELCQLMPIAMRLLSAGSAAMNDSDSSVASLLTLAAMPGLASPVGGTSRDGA